MELELLNDESNSDKIKTGKNSSENIIKTLEKEKDIIEEIPDKKCSEKIINSDNISLEKGKQSKNSNNSKINISEKN